MLRGKKYKKKKKLLLILTSIRNPEKRFFEQLPTTVDRRAVTVIKRCHRHTKIKLHRKNIVDFFSFSFFFHRCFMFPTVTVEHLEHRASV